MCPFSNLAFLQPTTVDKEPEFCPFSSLAFLQPTTVDKEPLKQTRSVLQKASVF